MTALLTLCTQQEASDILDWMHTHAAETDWPHGTTAATIWLHQIVANADDDAYPHFVAVPDEHVEAIAYAIEDWIEVLTSHDEELLTTLDKAELK